MFSLPGERRIDKIETAVATLAVEMRDFKDSTAAMAGVLEKLVEQAKEIEKTLLLNEERKRAAHEEELKAERRDKARREAEDKAAAAKLERDRNVSRTAMTIVAIVVVPALATLFSHAQIVERIGALWHHSTELIREPEHPKIP